MSMYYLVGLSGYLLFGACVCDNISVSFGTPASPPTHTSWKFFSFASIDSVTSDSGGVSLALATAQNKTDGGDSLSDSGEFWNNLFGPSVDGCMQKSTLQRLKPQR